MTNKPTVRIVNWSFIQEQDPYKAPELRKVKLQGNALNHKFHLPGAFVVTTSLQDWDTKEGWAESRNTRYQLVGPAMLDKEPPKVLENVHEYE